MQVVTLEVTIPKVLLSLGLRKDEIQQKLQNWLIISLFRDGRISSGKAGNLLGISRRAFLDLLHREGVAYFDYSEEEWHDEVEAARKLQPAVQTEA